MCFMVSMGFFGQFHITVVKLHVHTKYIILFGKLS
jgi:hypothetical protein